MKLFLPFFLFTIITVNAQNFSTVKSKVDQYPKLTSVDNLAKLISEDFSSDKNRVKAAFYWITHNIRYDLAAFYNPKNKRVGFRYKNETERLQKIQEIKDNIVSETLQNRKAVCEGYAQTLAKICTILNIENEVIKGYIRNSSRDINKPQQRSNHAWNAVKLNNKWQYIDATWAAGAVVNKRWQPIFNAYYYNIPIKNYFKTHFPEDKLWQLRVGRISLTDFYNQPIYSRTALNSVVEIVSPKKGVLPVNNNTINIELKNLNDKSNVMCGFKGHRFAVKPTIERRGNITKITITPPNRSKELFLIIDKEVMYEFLIQ